METKVTIKIEPHVHKELNLLKANMGFKTLSEAIDWLVKGK